MSADVCSHICCSQFQCLSKRMCSYSRFECLSGGSSEPLVCFYQNVCARFWYVYSNVGLCLTNYPCVGLPVVPSVGLSVSGTDVTTRPAYRSTQNMTTKAYIRWIYGYYPVTRLWPNRRTQRCSLVTNSSAKQSRTTFLYYSCRAWCW